MKSKYSNGLFSNRRSSTGPRSARTFEQAARSVRMRARGKCLFLFAWGAPANFLSSGLRRSKRSNHHRIDHERKQRLDHRDEEPAPQPQGRPSTSGAGCRG